MFIQSWKYENKKIESVEYDRVPCPYLNRAVDLGWKEDIRTVHNWVNSLNVISVKIYKELISVINIIEMTQNTFDLICLKSNKYFNSNTYKLGNHRSIVINNNIDDDILNLYFNNKVLGQINILK